jgi:hypothetical protein
MTIDEESILALKHVRNIHKEVARYLLGFITLSELIDLIRAREQAFSAEAERKRSPRRTKE